MTDAELAAAPARSYDERKAKPATVVRKVAPSPASVAELDANTWGYTEDEIVVPTIAVSRDIKRGVWYTSLRKLEGHYSLQTQLLPGVTEVTGPGGNTDATNWQEQVYELNALGDHPGPSNWYMIRAVEEHEKVHANSLKAALDDVAVAIENDYTQLTVPLAGNPNATAAIAAVQALPEYADAATDGRELWDDKYLEYIDADHVGRTPPAEHKVVDPMVEQIKKVAKARAW